jgi:hypothetical protein
MVRPLRLLAVLAMCVAIATATSAAAIALAPPATTIDGQDGRRPSNPLAQEARRARAAVELFRSGERNFVPDPNIIGSSAGQPQARPTPDRTVPVIPRPGVGVIASLLLGLIGGVVGGCAALVGWTAAARRRPRLPASVT